MFGRVSSSSEGAKEVPSYVEEVGLSLKTAYNNIRQSIEKTHKANKSRHDKKVSGCNFAVGDLVWLYVPAVKPGRTKKFSCLWRGPYTVIDKTGPVDYKIQLLGSMKTIVVHRNRLKTCYGRPQWKSVTGTNKSEQGSQPSNKNNTTERSGRSYAQAAAGAPLVPSPGGYTSTDDIMTSTRLQQNRRPPDRYRP